MVATVGEDGRRWVAGFCDVFLGFGVGECKCALVAGS